MEHRENGRSTAKQAAPETAAHGPGDEGRPSTEDEIKLGVNQDRATSGSFSPEPDEEASSTDKI